MSFKLTVIQKPTYLHIVITGENTKENVMSYFDSIRSECASRNCHRVLVEERLEGPRLETMDVFELAVQGSVNSVGQFQAMAYVDRNAVSDSMIFAETVARNRAIPIRVFSKVSDAEQWLLGEPRQQDP